MSTRSIRRVDPGLVAARWDDLFQPIFQDFAGRSETEQGGLISPAIDVAEDAASLRISAELPGLDKKDIDLHVKDGVLVLRGQKSQEREAREGKSVRIERRYGSFYRALALPETVDSARIEASFKNGVLSVRLPKREESKPQGIAIKD